MQHLHMEKIMNILWESGIFDLEIEDGQVIVLCGESGCGKTTLTRMINGLIPHYYEGN